MFFDSSLGIDFKRNHLVLTILKKSFGRIRLADYRIYPIWSEGQKEVREGQWISLISSFVSKHQVRKEKVSICIPREKVVLRFLRLPAAVKENLRKVLEYEAPKYTPFDKEPIYIDYQLLREEKEWIHLVALFARKAGMDLYLSLLKRIGIHPVSIQIPSVAALNLFCHHGAEKGRETVVLVDASEASLEMNVLQNGTWKESFHLPLPAEGREGNILQACKAAGLNGEALHRAAFFVYGLETAEKSGPPLGELQGLNPSAPPLNRLLEGKSASHPDYIYSSIGVALKGLAKPRVGLNLLPLEMRRQVRQIAKPLFMVLISLAFLLTLTWGAGMYTRYSTAINGLRAEVKKKKPEVEAVEKLQKRKVQVGREIAELEKISAEEVSKILVLKELTRILPPTVWIWNMKFSGRELEISGFADSSSELISLLDHSPLFEKVEFLAPVTKERGRMGAEKEKERFKIKMRLETRRAGS